MKFQEVGQHLIVRYHKGQAKLRFKGTGVSVRKVLLDVAKGKTFKGIVAAHPKLTWESVAEAVQLAAEALVEPYAAHHTAVSALRRAGRGEEVRLLKPWPIGKHLEIHPNVCFGRLTFDGTRLPVETMLTYLAMRGTIEYILNGWPYLKREALVEAIRLAAAALEERYTAQDEAVHEPALSRRVSSTK